MLRKTPPVSPSRPDASLKKQRGSKCSKEFGGMSWCSTDKTNINDLNTEKARYLRALQLKSSFHSATKPPLS